MASVKNRASFAGVLLCLLVIAGCGNSNGTTHPGSDGGQSGDMSIATDMGMTNVDMGPITRCGPGDDPDNDTISSMDEGTADPDHDGVPNDHDPDSDGDGILDSVEAGDANCTTAAVDTDGNGTPDYLDLDSDGDKVSDHDEGGGDVDRDGILNFRDLDSDGDSVSDTIESGDADLTTPPISCPREINYVTQMVMSDGLPDYIDTDSDNDGLSDGQEAQVGSNPCMIDTDSDGETDLVEGAYVEVNCPSGTGNYCDCAHNSSCRIPPTDYFLVLPYGGDPQQLPLQFGTTIRVADVFFISDTTGSMGSVVASVQQTVATPSTGLIDRISATIPDAWFGGGQHDDVPAGGWGEPGTDQPFILAIGMNPPSNASAVQAAFAAIQIHSGNDGPESQTFALYETVTGMGGTWNFTDGSPTYTMPNYKSRCLDQTWGAPCFRNEALPIIVHFTDICSHNAPPGDDPSCDAYSGVNPAIPSWTDTIAALNRRGAKYIGVNSNNTACPAVIVPDPSLPCYFMKRTCEETGSVDLNGDPLVYNMPYNTDPTTFVDTLTGAINTMVTQVPIDVDTSTRSAPSNPLMVDARQFIKRRTPGCLANPAVTPCWEAPMGVSSSQAVATVDMSTFFGVVPGTQVTFVITFQNNFFMGTGQTEIFVAYIDVRAGGSSVLDTRQVYIVVPATSGPLG